MSPRGSQHSKMGYDRQMKFSCLDVQSYRCSIQSYFSQEHLPCARRSATFTTIRNYRLYTNGCRVYCAGSLGANLKLRLPARLLDPTGLQAQCLDFNMNCENYLWKVDLCELADLSMIGEIHSGLEVSS